MFRINFIGYNYKENPSFIINREKGSSDYLLLYFRSEITIYINNKPVKCKKNTLILYDKGYPQKYHNPKSGFTNDFVHFDVSKDSDFFNNLSLPFNKPFILDDADFVSNRIEEISLEIEIKNNLYKEKISSILQILLIDIERKYTTKNSIYNNSILSLNYNKFKAARLNILTDFRHDWQVDEMAKLVNLSSSRFSILYKKYFYISPKEDLNRKRLVTSKYLLKHTTLSVEEISLRVGYSNIFHFSKQFKKTYKVSPSVYRSR